MATTLVAKIGVVHHNKKKKEKPEPVVFDPLTKYLSDQATFIFRIAPNEFSFQGIFYCFSANHLSKKAMILTKT